MKKFFLNLQFIFKPDFWDVLIPFNKQWDDDLNYLIDNVPAKLDESNCFDRTHYNIIFGRGDDIIYVWIRNYPYSYGKPFKPGDYNYNYRPSRLTILKLRKLEQKLKKNLEQ